MAENEEGLSLKRVLENGLGYLSSIISEKIYPRREEEKEDFTKNIDDLAKVIEKRILGKVLSFLIIGVGLVFLVLALHTYLSESLGWGSVLTNLIIGMVIFVIGLITKLREYERLENGKY